MKLLLDQNLSYQLVGDLQAWYPGTSQVRLLGMERADDKIIWDHARQQGFTIVTQDSDFHELSVLYGSPPKVVWLKCGNSSKDTVRRILIGNFQAINQFHQAITMPTRISIPPVAGRARKPRTFPVRLATLAPPAAGSHA